MRFLLFILLLITSHVSGQEHAYVNTDNLLLRSVPEKIYKVRAILHAPCEIKIAVQDLDYKNNKAIHNRFYEASVILWNEDGTSLSIYGWVEKKYTVKSRAGVTYPGTDTVKRTVTAIPVISYMGPEKYNPNPVNCTQYPYPKYKGGEKHFDMPVAKKRIYHPGPRGGCYYIGPGGKKKYVRPSLCK